MTDQSGRGSTIFIAVPVYRGTRFIAETLESILAQTHRDLRVMISVDGKDTASADACAPFLSDERVRMVVQERQLGWVANLNGLIEACDGDFYCYWQQDDHCAPDYLEKLLVALADHPDAACAYSDVRWFERIDRVDSLPEIVGFTQERILAQIEALDWIPLRALVPTSVLRQVGPIGGLDGSGYFADCLWVLRLAAVGDLIRVPEALYRKRDHAESASKVAAWEHDNTPRNAWIRLGVAIFSEMAVHFPGVDRHKLAMVIADRLVMRRPGRWFRHDAAAVSASEQAQVVMDFLAALESTADMASPFAGLASPQGPGDELRAHFEGAPSGSVTRLIAEQALAVSHRQELIGRLHEYGALVIDCSAGGAAAEVLVRGWSPPEEWGTWSEGSSASLWLPLPADGTSWRIRLIGQPYRGADEAPAQQRIIVSEEGRVLVDHRLAEVGDIPSFRLTRYDDGGDGVSVDIDMPDAVSPAALGLSEDQRPLTLGLYRIEVERAGVREHDQRESRVDS